MTRFNKVQADRRDLNRSQVEAVQAATREQVRQEIALAEKERSKKAALLTRNGAYAAVGGILGILAAFVFLLGLAVAASHYAIAAGLPAGAAYLATGSIVALVLGFTASVLIHRFGKSFLRLLKDPSSVATNVVNPALPGDLTSSDAIPTILGSTGASVDPPPSPIWLARGIAEQIKRHPYRTLLLTAAGASFGGYLFRRNSERLRGLKNRATRWHLRWRNRA